MNRKGSLLIKMGITIIILGIAIFTMHNVMKSKEQDKSKETGNTLPETVITLAETLYAKKNPYVGDASANHALLRSLPPFGEVTYEGMELQTDKEPYAMTLNYMEERMDLAINTDQMIQDAVLLFATIDNMGEVTYKIYKYGTEEFISGQVNYTIAITREQVDDLVGKDVRTYATSSQKLQQLVDMAKKYQMEDLSK